MVLRAMAEGALAESDRAAAVCVLGQGAKANLFGPRDAVGQYVKAGDLKAERRFPTFETGRDELALCEAILQSSRNQRWVPLPYEPRS
jgi:hypothetical protein